MFVIKKHIGKGNAHIRTMLSPELSDLSMISLYHLCLSVVVHLWITILSLIVAKPYIRLGIIHYYYYYHPLIYHYYLNCVMNPIIYKGLNEVHTHKQTGFNLNKRSSICNCLLVFLPRFLPHNSHCINSTTVVWLH